jgi:Eco57I restriction-modification methylase
MQRRQHTMFSTVQSEGAILPMDLLQRIALLDPALDGLAPESYHLLKTERLNEAINHSWNRLMGAWSIFKAARDKLPEREMGTTLTRERWLLPLFSELGFGRLSIAKNVEVQNKSYPISHLWQQAPIHLVGCGVDLDHMTRGVAGAARSSPHSLVQELLNHSDSYLWGFVSNGLRLRLLRDKVSITRQAYVEFDLEEMMDGEVYADFVLLWLLCHESRVEGEPSEECWLEKWSRTAQKEGTRVLDHLRDGVEQAIAALGSGFLAHPSNASLRDWLRGGQLSTQDYYRQILRIVYRLIVLFVAEDRDMLFHPEASETARTCYTLYYSMSRLRRLAEQRMGTRHFDLFSGLRLVMEKLGTDDGYPELGLPALNSFLFSQEAIPDLADSEIPNRDLLDAIRALAFTSDGHARRVVDYRNLGPEELGSVYESLLELHPVLHIDTATFKLDTASGHERKTTGSYYTPTSLITSLLDSALDPVLDEASSKADPETAILSLKVCDPACGSGHFLIAAAHRIARRLAAVRTGEEEPPPQARRKALRDVIGRCIYGVDLNPMSVELCKVNLWMEAIEPGKPLSFLEQHIQCGNSLLGATPALLVKGIPDSAFEPIEGDDKKICSEYKKKNKGQREGNRSFWDAEGLPWDRLGDLATSMIRLEEIGDDTVESIRRKQEYYNQLVQSSDYLNGRLWADAWCAAFVWKKNNEFAYPITEEVFRNIEKDPYKISTWMRNEIKRLRELYQFFHWHLAFLDVFRVPTKGETPENEQAGWSGGFDVVLGNPPWEHTELKEQEWFANRDPEIANAAGAERKRKIEVLAVSNPALYNEFLEARRQEDGGSHFIRNSARYPLCGRGRINTYAIFAETNRLILSSKGRVGCIVQSGIATDDTNKSFFKQLVDSHTLVSLFDFRNEVKLFPGIDHQVKFTLLTTAGISTQIIKADFAFGLYTVEDLLVEARHFSLSSDEIALFNPNTYTCPIFRSKRDMILTKAIYSRLPVFINEHPPQSNPWNIILRQGVFNMTSDSHLFRTRTQLEMNGWHLEGNTFLKDGEMCLPLYEGKMIGLFDHRFGTYKGREQGDRELDEVLHSDPIALPLPRYWVHSSHLPPFLKDGRKAFLVSRIIARSTDARTAIFNLLPVVPCGNSLATFIVNSTYTHELLWLNSCASSFVFDYVVRQKLGGPNMNFFILKQLPVLLPDNYTATCKWDDQTSLGNWIWPRALELTYTAWDLEPFANEVGYNSPPFRWDEERRFLLLCELDAAYFHLYSIERDDLDYIMETFPIVKQRDEEQFKEYRTKRVILEIYDELQRAMETGKPYQTMLQPLPADPSLAHSPRMGMKV